MGTEAKNKKRFYFVFIMPYASVEWSGSTWVVKGQVPFPLVEQFLDGDATAAQQNYKWEAGWRLRKDTVLPLFFDSLEGGGFRLITAVDDLKGQCGSNKNVGGMFVFLQPSKAAG